MLKHPHQLLTIRLIILLVTHSHCENLTSMYNFIFVEVKEKENTVEKHENSLFKTYQTLTSNSSAEDLLATVIRRKKILQDLEMLVQHK